MNGEPAAQKKPERGFVQGTLDFIERAGNKVPHPALLFLGLCVGLIVLSQILAWIGVGASYEVVKPPAQSVEAVDVGGSQVPAEILPAEQPNASDYRVVHETVKVKGLLTGDGVRFLFTSFVGNFQGFTAMAIILVVMIGVGVAERSGLIAALIRKLVHVASAGALTYIIVFLGIVSSIASDAGYLVLIPLGAVAFKSIGKNPMAGLAAAFAGVAGGFGVNLLITPTDAVLTEITNDSVHLIEPAKTIDLTANLWFGIISTIMLTLLLGVVTSRIVERRLGTYDPGLAPEPGSGEIQAADDAPPISPEAEKKGLRWAGIALLFGIVVIALLTAIPGAPLRDPQTGSVIGTSPFMDSLIPMISGLFLLAGLGFGWAAGTLRSATDAITMVTESWATLAGLLLLFLLIAQFIAYFNYSEIPQVAAVRLGDLFERLSIGTVWLLILAVLITAVVDIIMPQAIAKWALLAPIFIPLFLRLGTDPAAVLAAYRVGDSPVNIVTPIMAYFPLIVVFASRYDKHSGIGTVIALMLPYFIALIVAWTVLLALWYVFGLSWGF